MADIKIYGTLKNATESGKVALASQVYDEALGKFQSEINAVEPDYSIERRYNGSHIRVFSNRNICRELIIPVQGISQYNGKYIQGMAIYGKYAFLTYDTGYIRVLDLDTNEFQSSYAMPEGVYGPNNHTGMANFGPNFYIPGDDFPLLYISSYLENCCYVLRVTLSGLPVFIISLTLIRLVVTESIASSVLTILIMYIRLLLLCQTQPSPIARELPLTQSCWIPSPMQTWPTM